MNKQVITEDKKLKIPDLISIGVYTAVYFVMVTIATFGSNLLLPGFSYVFLPAISALISGCIYMLMAAKVPKFGAITIMGTVVGLFLFSSGHFVLSLIAGVLCSVLADLIGKATAYKNKLWILASYLVFSFGLMGPVLPLWFMKDTYIAKLEARGKDAAYIEGVFANINQGTFVIAVVSILICAVLGGVFGQKMMRKHFEKAGIVS